MAAALASIILGSVLHLSSTANASQQDDVADHDMGRAEAATAYVHAGQTASLGLIPPSASLSADHDMRGSHAVVSFHRLQSRTASGGLDAIWVARLRSSDQSQVVTRYADSRNCPQVSATLVLMERVELPAVDLPGIPVGGVETGPFGEITMDDYSYTLRTGGTFRSSITYGSLVVSGDSLSPIGALTQLAQQGLGSCWTTQLPPDLTS